MRVDCNRPGTGLTYEIRNIVEVANRVKEKGVDIAWMNIGDPIQQGEVLPLWMRTLLSEIVLDNSSYAYSPTRGMDEAREYIAARNNARGGAQITKDNIIFFNGLGDAIGRFYSVLGEDVRVMIPEPSYSTHYMAEALHLRPGKKPLTYRLQPDKGWAPDLQELERKVKENQDVVGITLINPDNPTGYVPDEATLREIVRIARENDLFLLFDEVYINLVYNGKTTVALSDVIGNVPGISLKGMSKEMSWPGARCGWMEVYNSGKDASFDRAIAAVLSLKMSEVCSTTFPQMALPRLMEHPEYIPALNERIAHYEKLSKLAYEAFQKNPYVIANLTHGALYMTVTFKEGVLNDKMSLPVADESLKAFVEKSVAGGELDKRFVYYLLASKGICIVPLTGFFTELLGFRMTLLEKNVDKFRAAVNTLSEAIVEYIGSTKGASVG